MLVFEPFCKCPLHKGLNKVCVLFACPQLFMGFIYRQAFALCYKLVIQCDKVIISLIAIILLETYRMSM